MAVSGCLSPQLCFEVSCHDSCGSGRPEPSLQSRAAPCGALTAYWCTPASFLASKRALILLLLCQCYLLFPLQGGQPHLREINLPVCLVRLRDGVLRSAGRADQPCCAVRAWVAARRDPRLANRVCLLTSHCTLHRSCRGWHLLAWPCSYLLMWLSGADSTLSNSSG